VRPVVTDDAVTSLQAAWLRLFFDSASRNPFGHPVWLTTWARHFIKPRQLYLLAAYDDLDTLVGVAPFYRRTYRVAPGLSATAVQLLGSNEHGTLTELAQVLAVPGYERPVLAAVMRYLIERPEDWDWIELILAPNQGWFEPHWLAQTGGPSGAFVVHKGTRACVVLPLPRTWDELRSSLKRNIKESLRRGVNSLKNSGLSCEVVKPHDEESLREALATLAMLHGRRSQVSGKIGHPDNLVDCSDSAFLTDVATALFGAGQVVPYTLLIDGTPAASQLVIMANGVTFLSLSGFDPKWWSHNVSTTLQSHCLREAICRGDTIANFSPGPNVAKLRWSEQLELYQEFVVVNGRRRSRLAFSLFWQLRAAAVLRRESHRHEVVSSSS